MPLYICQGRYTREAATGLIANPEDRQQAAAKLFESVGGELLSYYVTFGTYDWLIVLEAPNEIAVTASVVAAAAGGGVCDIATTVAMSSADFKKALELGAKAASAFMSAGHS